MRIADFKCALRIGSGKTDGNSFVKRHAVFYWLVGIAIAAMAIMLKVELLLLFVGGIFVIEAVSVILQVLSFKWWGRRIFLMAPIHHHFEMKAWSETKIMVRFWIVTGILCAAGFALFYKYYPQLHLQLRPRR